VSVGSDAPALTLDAATLRRAFTAAAGRLYAERGRIDALNVYPVPDGDTGANMSGTLREAVAAVEGLPEGAAILEVLATLAKAALYAARGNSGVILSQALRGFATGIGEVETVDGEALARALREASAASYRAVGKPVEGTMLTVLRLASEGASEVANRWYGDVLMRAVESAQRAEANTINQLPALMDAGVTDAGGEGICVILGALLDSCLGRATGEGNVADDSLEPAPLARFEGHSPEAFGSCTEFVIEPSSGELDEAAVRAMVSSGTNRSVVMVGDATVLRVHVHADDPQALLAQASLFGRVSRVKVEDMATQFTRFRAEGSGAGAKVAVLALSPGAGFSAVFESLGVHVMDTSTSRKPSAGAILEAAERLNVADVIVLPNHKDIVPAALQAAATARCTITVVPTFTLLAGIAAALSFESQAMPSASVDAMTAALASVRTVEVTTAAASRTIEGIAVRAGQAIALVNGKLRAVADDQLSALTDGILHCADETTTLVTLYAGSGVGPDDMEVARSAVQAKLPDAEVQAIAGGQPLYPWIASVE